MRRPLAGGHLAAGIGAVGWRLGADPNTRRPRPTWSTASSRPCVCVARDLRWGRAYESFGEDPGLVIKMETAIDGLQGRAGREQRRRHRQPGRRLDNGVPREPKKMRLNAADRAAVDRSAARSSSAWS
jgi:Glycosyl hydrolase family 3 N terminal domain